MARQQFDVFITADKNLRYQQNLKERTIAIIELPRHHAYCDQAIGRDRESNLGGDQNGEYVQVEMPE